MIIFPQLRIHASELMIFVDSCLERERDSTSGTRARNDTAKPRFTASVPRLRVVPDAALQVSSSRRCDLVRLSYKAMGILPNLAHMTLQQPEEREVSLQAVSRSSPKAEPGCQCRPMCIADLLAASRPRRNCVFYGFRDLPTI